MDQQELNDIEKLLTAKRLYDLILTNKIIGHFDKKHIKTIHKRIFKDIFSWARKFRTVDIYKDGTSFAPHKLFRQNFEYLEEQIREKNKQTYTSKK